jgi:hypothetical protein
MAAKTRARAARPFATLVPTTGGEVEEVTAPPKSRYVITVVLALLAFTAGWVLPRASTTPAQSAPTGLMDAQLKPPETNPEARAVEVPDESSFYTAGQPYESLVAALRGYSGQEAISRFFALLEQMDAADIEELMRTAISESETEDERSRSVEVWSLLSSAAGGDNDWTMCVIDRWVELDGEGMIGFFNRLGSPEYLEYSYPVWARRNLDAARQQLATETDPDRRKLLAEAIATALLPTQSLEALQLAQEHGVNLNLHGQHFDRQSAEAIIQFALNEFDKPNTGMSVFDAWASVEPSAALERAAELEDPETKHWAMRNAILGAMKAEPGTALGALAELPKLDENFAFDILKRVATRDREQAIQWVSGLSSELSSKMMESLRGYSYFSSAEPMLAGVVIDMLPRDDVFLTHLEYLLRDLSEFHPQEAMDILERTVDALPADQKPRSNTGFSIQSMTHRLMAQDLAGTLTRLNALSDPVMRTGFLKGVGSWFGINDIDQGIAWLQTLPEQDRGDAAAQLLSAVPAHRTNELLASWEPGLIKDASTRHTALARFAENQLAGASPEESRAWLQDKFGDEAAAVVSRSRIVGTLANENPENALTWIDAFADSPQYPDMVLKVIDKWGDFDSVAASSFVRQVEPGPLRDRLLDEVVGWHTNDDPAGALQWASEIGDDEIRGQAIEHLPQTMRVNRFTPGEQAAIIRESSLPDPDKSRLLEKVGSIN